jgi:hypothetical protein
VNSGYNMLDEKQTSDNEEANARTTTGASGVSQYSSHSGILKIVPDSLLDI